MASFGKEQEQIILTSSDFQNAFDKYIKRELVPKDGGEGGCDYEAIKRQIESLDITWEQGDSQTSVSAGPVNALSEWHKHSSSPTDCDQRSLGGHLKLANHYLIVHIAVSSLWMYNTKEFSSFLFQMRSWCTLNPAQFQLDDSVSVESELHNQKIRQRIKNDSCIQNFMVHSPTYPPLGNNDDTRQSISTSVAESDTNPKKESGTFTSEHCALFCHLWEDNTTKISKEGKPKLTEVSESANAECDDQEDHSTNLWLDDTAHLENCEVERTSVDNDNVSEFPSTVHKSKEFLSTSVVCEKSLEFIRRALFSEIPTIRMLLILLISLPWLSQQHDKNGQDPGNNTKLVSMETSILNNASTTSNSDEERMFKFYFESFESMGRAHSIAKELILEQLGDDEPGDEAMAKKPPSREFIAGENPAATKIDTTSISGGTEGDPIQKRRKLDISLPG